MTEVRCHALMKLAERTLAMYADTQEPSDVAFVFGKLVENLNEDIGDNQLISAINKVIEEDLTEVKQ